MIAFCWHRHVGWGWEEVWETSWAISCFASQISNLIMLPLTTVLFPTLLDFNISLYSAFLDGFLNPSKCCSFEMRNPCTALLVKGDFLIPVERMLCWGSCIHCRSAFQVQNTNSGHGVI